MIDELVGQIVWGFISSGDDIASAEAAARKGHLAGVWLLPTEMRSPAETVLLVNRLQRSSPKPLFVGVDAEAGLGLVMGRATLLPTAMALGATGDEDLVRAAALVTAHEASSCGINAIAAPVLDVNVNPLNPIINTRAFGASPKLVSRLGAAFIDAMQARSPSGGRVLAIGKHFPGHGDTGRDSHLYLDSVRHQRERLEDVELPPFRAAIEAGVPMLMTSHVAYPALDASGMPATLSRPIMTELLRRELGFNGVAVTDCMNMHAVAHNYDAREAAVKAVQAGCDLVLTDRWDLTYEALMRAAMEDQLSLSRLEEAAGRVRAAKSILFGPDLDHPPLIDADRAPSSVGSQANLDVAERIASASITLVEGHLTPPSTRPLIMATRMARRFGPPVEMQLRNALSALGWDDADILMLDPMPDEAQVRKAIEHARLAGWAALLHFNRVQPFDPEAVLTSDELVRLVDEVNAAGVRVLCVSMGSPYALPRFAAATAQLCAYSTSDASLRATLRVLKGESDATGRLPVPLPAPAVSF